MKHEDFQIHTDLDLVTMLWTPQKEKDPICMVLCYQLAFSLSILMFSIWLFYSLLLLAE